MGFYKGRLGESLARKFLETTKNFKFVARNWKSRYGEIDLIMKDGAETVFVEVKFRNHRTFGDGEMALGFYKIRKLKRAINFYIDGNPVTVYRLDAVVIELAPWSHKAQVRYYPNIC